MYKFYLFFYYKWINATALRVKSGIKLNIYIYIYIYEPPHVEYWLTPIVKSTWLHPQTIKAQCGGFMRNPKSSLSPFISLTHIGIRFPHPSLAAAASFPHSLLLRGSFGSSSLSGEFSSKRRNNKSPWSYVFCWKNGRLWCYHMIFLIFLIFFIDP